jgi:A/G-specific adenine glycosylase
MSGELSPDSPLPSSWNGRTTATIRRKILAWFAKHQRQLPWRHTRDPYRIWVSEVMLQQTTVAAVLPYFERFLLAFPTVQHLAAADEQAVLKLWQGLGYYRRARHLHAAAKTLVQDHSGELPDDPAVWAELPGVGRYILGAVLSQAFDRRLPIVEANTLRVFSRLCGSMLDPRSGAGLRWVWAAAERLLPGKCIGDFNQAMMELGALICTPATPNCHKCPLNKECIAFAEGIQETIPPKARRVEGQSVREVAVVLRNAGKILICQRPTHASRWPLMWEIPHGEVYEGEEETKAAKRIAMSIGFTASIGPEIMAIRHTVTRFSITMLAFEANAIAGEFNSQFYMAGEWRKPSEMSDLPTSAPQQILLKELGMKNRQKRLF